MSRQILLLENGLFDLGLDNYGVLHYTNHADWVGKKLAAIMKPGAILLMRRKTKAVSINGVKTQADLGTYFSRTGAFKAYSDGQILIRTKLPWKDVDLDRCR